MVRKSHFFDSIPLGIKTHISLVRNEIRDRKMDPNILYSFLLLGPPEWGFLHSTSGHGATLVTAGIACARALRWATWRDFAVLRGLGNLLLHAYKRAMMSGHFPTSYVSIALSGSNKEIEIRKNNSLQRPVWDSSYHLISDPGTLHIQAAGLSMQPPVCCTFYIVISLTIYNFLMTFITSPFLQAPGPYLKIMM